MSSTEETTQPQHPQPQQQKQQHVILFYKFHPLSGERDIVELYRTALENLCQNLKLQGRILVGCNEHQSEGINGTLSGNNLKNVQGFTQALMGKNQRQQQQQQRVSTTTETTTVVDASTNKHDDDADDSGKISTILNTFWKECDEFYQKANCTDNPLIMDESEFKWSKSTDEHQLFPDLNIKIVNELIGTGNVLAPIPLTDVHKGYLTPKEWHERIAELKNDNNDNKNNNDTILIDCRNTKEWQIGHFPGAVDPNTTTFNQFPNWVRQHSQSLASKKVLMYCTGGIRCEKASAYIRTQVPSVKEVCHLKGGIHKYLDEYGSQDDNLWMGKNFVFDGRVAQGAAEGEGNDTSGTVETKQSSSSTDNIVGSCTYCTAPFDSFDPGCVCTVCREPTLVCYTCRPNVIEFHCKNHQHLKTCYFTDLSSFSKLELQHQLQELQSVIAEIAVGKKFRQKRKTLYKQCDKIMERLEMLEGEGEGGGGSIQTIANDIETKTAAATVNGQVELKCRNCGEIGCPGRCWGFHGLKRKRVLEETKQKSGNEAGSVASSAVSLFNKNSAKNKNNNAHLQEQKQREKEEIIRDLKRLKLARPPSTGRDPVTGVRVPTPCTRTLQSKTKGKWCGMAVLAVLQEEFSELSDTNYLAKIMARGLLRVNNEKISTLEQAENRHLKNMDVVSRIVHWHEPPVHIPNDRIGVQKMPLPQALREEYNLARDDDNDAVVYVCHKPSSVPVHPAGPYLSNSMTMLVEAQEGLEPKSLIPCHRIDRVTSGMTLCCTNVKVARMLQGRIDEGSAQKQYLAQVVGKFPESSSDSQALPALKDDNADDALAKWSWNDINVLVDAPIETVDPANGIRKITPNGKSSQSLFRLLSYDTTTNTSILSCTPLTGRSHQLRVHLQYLGFPIVKDVLYGGGAAAAGATDNNSTTPLEKDMGGVNQLKKSIQGVIGNTQEAEDDLKSESLLDQDVTAAKELCPCCSNVDDDFDSVYTPAQLLQGGHEICLHAFRYRIPFASKKKKKGQKKTNHKKKEQQEEEEEDPSSNNHKEKEAPQLDDKPTVPSPVAVLDFQVGVPEWVPESVVVDLEWPASKTDMKL